MHLKHRNLEQVLRLAGEHLHSCGNDGELDNGKNDKRSISLDQLIPMHQSLLEVSALATQESGEDTAMSDVDVIDRKERPSWLELFLSSLYKNSSSERMLDDGEDCNDEKDLSLCREILKNGNDSQKLLVWQYLLQRARVDSPSSPSISSMEWFSSLIFHYILPTQEKGRMEINPSSAISDELTEVLIKLSLEWIFLEKKSEDRNDTIVWPNLREQLLTETKKIIAIHEPSKQECEGTDPSVVMPLSSKIASKLVLYYLAREHQHGEQLSGGNLSFFISLYYEHLWCNLQFCCRNFSVDLLSDISQNLLLPLLNEFQTKTSMTTEEVNAHSFELAGLLQTKLFHMLQKEGVFHIRENDNEEKVHKQDLLLVATTTLCPLLPWYWKHTRQQLNQQQENELLWNVIYSCFELGRRSLVHPREYDTGRGRRGGDGVFGTGGVASLLRRRALHLLDVITTTHSTSKEKEDCLYWKDFILCAETFEMEGERHIVDQIWPVIAKLIREAWKNKNCIHDTRNIDGGIPLVTRPWIELLLGRVLSSEQMAVRKLGILRILQAMGRPVTADSLQKNVEDEIKTSGSEVDVEMEVSHDTHNENNNNPSNKKRRESKSHKQHRQPKKKKKTSTESTSLDVLSTEMLLRFLSPETFLWDILVPSWDSLGGSSVGYTIHIVESKHRKRNNNSGIPMEKFSKIDMIPLFCQTIRNYAILADAASLETYSSLLSWSPSLFWKGIWNWNRVGCHLSAKTHLSVFRSVSDLLEAEARNEGKLATTNGGASSTIQMVPMDDSDLEAIRFTYVKLFRHGLMVLTHRKQLLHMLSLMLSKAKLYTNSEKRNWTPLKVLSLLGLFSSSYFPSLDSEDVVDWSIEKEEMLMRIGIFIEQLNSQASAKNQGQQQMPFIVTVGAALATAFVTGQVSLPTNTDGLASPPRWNPVEGSSKSDVEMGWAVSLFCTLAVSRRERYTSGELLWPAIHKGLSQSSVVILSKDHNSKTENVARALLLLENGCRLRQLSGLGNGDLVVSPKTQQIMPPPPNIEQMLQNSIDFIQWHIRMLLGTDSHRVETEDTKNKRFTGSYASLISQLKILHQSYPSSQAISGVMNDVLHNCTENLSVLMEGNDSSSGEGDVKKLLLVGLIYGACSCGAEPGKKSYVSLCRLLMRTGLTTSGEGQPKAWVKSSRSIIQYGRWAAISCILPKILEMTSENVCNQTQGEIDNLVDDLIKEGMAASSITPSDAIKPLFDCLIISSRQWICASSKYDPHQVENMYIQNLTDITKTLLSLINQSTRSRESAYMLNEFCALIFHSKLLREEYERIQSVPLKCMTPIRDAFRQLIKMAGRRRPQITRAVLCRITVGWLGNGNKDSMGISSIPYRDDIVQLLLHKEAKKDESSTNQSAEELPTSGVMEIPANTNELSVTRAFLLVFFCQLPDPEAGLHDVVKKELLHYVILELLKQATPEKGTHPSLVMKGTPTYCIKIRGWQALCILSRFVTNEIAPSVCKTVFQAMNELLHNQIRYFLENFTIRCSMMHSTIFGEAFLQDISRTDLSLQHVSSLMIMGGNFILGKYQLDYFTQSDKDKSRAKRILAGVIPWLSSTQGFSRAIAQLVVYNLIPRVTSIESMTNDNDWFLKSTYNFLDQNREMKRLRNKQTKFFDQYDCESLCTPEGVFSIRVDESQEADPVHMIDAIKQSLRNTYDEAHESDAPSWKQMEELMADNDANSDSEGSENIGSAVQRKIIPLDSLNLTLEDLKEKRLSTATGAHKQNLIVCASLVDKVPNLAGLARTCEIFAAQSLVVPDMSVAKMDNFQSISVGAVDWIDMEEVKEEGLLLWLLEKKTEGFWIVGLEQTSSSIPLHQIDIPNFVAANNKTVLLLGKEKEGIPVQYLQAVDTCVEIPQFGMIRSLNVHVSGAITIWELTRRTRLMQTEKQVMHKN